MENRCCPLVKIHMQFCWLFFWAGHWYFKQRARIMVGLEHPTLRLRGRDAITKPPLSKILFFCLQKTSSNCFDTTPDIFSSTYFWKKWKCFASAQTGNYWKSLGKILLFPELQPYEGSLALIQLVQRSWWWFHMYYMNYISTPRMKTST